MAANEVKEPIALPFKGQLDELLEIGMDEEGVVFDHVKIIKEAHDWVLSLGDHIDPTRTNLDFVAGTRRILCVAQQRLAIDLGNARKQKDLWEEEVSTRRAKYGEIYYRLGRKMEGKTEEQLEEERAKLVEGRPYSWERADGLAKNHPAVLEAKDMKAHWAGEWDGLHKTFASLENMINTLAGDAKVLREELFLIMQNDQT